MKVPDATLELSIEQLIGALNKKIFMECSQAAMPPISRALVASMTDEVRAQKLVEGNLKC
jgi:hypothetical protein